jgi:L-threonylcarbamoyladenylate synthase
MNTRRFSLRQVLEDKGLLAVLARQVCKGALLVYPTETIYGIGGIATDEAVRDKIFEAKQRPQKNPLILVASAPEAFDYLNLDFPRSAHALAGRFWPGNLTLVLNLKGADETVAIRISDHPFITALLSLVKAPIFSTSANLSGKPYNPDPASIFRSFSGRVDVMVDAGWLPHKPPSTIVRATPDNIVVMIREGALPKRDIESVAGKVY